MRILLARNKTKNTFIKDSLKNQIYNQYLVFENKYSKRLPTNEELLPWLNQLSETIKGTCGQARKDAKFRDSKRFRFLCFFPFYGQSILGDALEKFNKEILQPLIDKLTHKLESNVEKILIH